MAALLGYYMQNASRNVPGQKIRVKAWKSIENAVSYVRRNMHRSIGVKDMSRAAGLSEAYFSRVFRRCLGLSPYAYLNVLRVDTAKRLLIQGEHNCSEAAARTGFRSVQVFSKAFRKATGLSPTEWVKRYAH
jgi:two-component system response regulator YesN